MKTLLAQKQQDIKDLSQAIDARYEFYFPVINSISNSPAKFKSYLQSPVGMELVKDLKKDIMLTIYMVVAKQERKEMFQVVQNQRQQLAKSIKKSSASVRQKSKNKAEIKNSIPSTDKKKIKALITPYNLNDNSLNRLMRDADVHMSLFEIKVGNEMVKQTLNNLDLPSDYTFSASSQKEINEKKVEVVRAACQTEPSEASMKQVQAYIDHYVNTGELPQTSSGAAIVDDDAATEQEVKLQTKTQEVMVARSMASAAILAIGLSRLVESKVGEDATNEGKEPPIMKQKSIRELVKDCEQMTSDCATQAKEALEDFQSKSLDDKVIDQQQTVNRHP